MCIRDRDKGCLTYSPVAETPVEDDWEETEEVEDWEDLDEDEKEDDLWIDDEDDEEEEF